MTVAKPGSITKHQHIKNLKILEPIPNDTYLNYEVYERFDLSLSHYQSYLRMDYSERICSICLIMV